MEMLTEIFQAAPGEAGPAPLEVVAALLGTYVLASLIGLVYRTTHAGALYSPGYVHTLIIMSVVTAIVIMVVGSNAARAFAVFGAFSMIRFRNALPETRDLGFIFFAMVVGMAAGAGRLDMAALCTVLICGLILLLSRFDLFSARGVRRLLRVRVPNDVDYSAGLDEALTQHGSEHELLQVEAVQAGMLTEYTYAVRLAETASPQALVDALQQINGNNRVLLLATTPDALGQDR